MGGKAYFGMDKGVFLRSHMTLVLSCRVLKNKLVSSFHGGPSLEMARSRSPTIGRLNVVTQQRRDWVMREQVGLSDLLILTNMWGMPM